MGREGGMGREREEGRKEGGEGGGRRGQSGWKGGEDRVDGREGMIVRE